MDHFDWEQEGNKRLRYLERENADLQREIAKLRAKLREMEWEISHVAKPEARTKGHVGQVSLW